MFKTDEDESLNEPLSFYHSTPSGISLIDSINERLDENLISLSMAEDILVSYKLIFIYIWLLVIIYLLL